MELPKTKIYKLNKVFATRNGMPVYTAARCLLETDKAMYLYGHGSIEAQTRYGCCCKCGAALSHPGSILLGIGPVCLGSWEVRDDMIRGKSQAEVDAIIGKAIMSKKVDGWVPKSCIKEILECTETVDVPPDHPKLKNGKAKTVQAKKAEQVYYQDTGLPAIKISFPFNYDDVARIKTLSGRRFVKDDVIPYWVCPLSLESLEQLKGWGFQISNELADFIQQSKFNAADIPENEVIEVPGLQIKLMPFQKVGVTFMKRKKGRVLIGDEMGLGKTIQAAAYLQLHRELRPALVVVPASLKLNWERELNKCIPNANVQVLSGRNLSIPLTGDIIVVNYDIIPNETEAVPGQKNRREILNTGWVGPLSQIRAKILVVDECAALKESKARRTKAMKHIAKGIPHIIGLSGTPIINRPREILNMVQMIDHSIFPNTWKFLQRYCNPTFNGYGWDFNGASNTDELHDILVNTIMLRRLKKDVLKDLPEIIRSFVPMELDNMVEYKRVEQDFINWVAEKKGSLKAIRASRAEQLSKIEALKQVAVAGKMKSVIGWIEDFLEVGNKLVVFGIHHSTIDALMKKFGRIAVKLDGTCTERQKQEAVDAFQNNPDVHLFVGNIKAAGVGHTLTAASAAAIIELPWTPGELDQAEARIHRIGQTRGVNIYFLLSRGTVEEKIAALLDSKHGVLGEVLDGVEAKPEDSLLDALLAAYEAA